MRKKVVALLVILVLITVSLWAQGQKPADAAKKTDVVRVGILLPLSGAQAIDGANMRNGYELGAYIVNNSIDIDLTMARTEGIPSLGGAKIELVFADDQGIPEKGMSETERLITGGSVAVISGAYSSAVTATAQMVAERYQFPFVNALSSSPMLNKMGLEWFFRTTPDDTIFMRTIYDFLEDLKTRDGATWKRIAILHEDSLWGTDCGNLLADFAKLYGYNLVSKISFPTGTVDLTSEVTRTKSANPEILVQFAYAQDQVLLVNTMKLLDFNVDMLIGGIQYPAIFEALGKDADGMYFREVFNEDIALTNKSAEKVVELWQKLYGGGFGNAPRAVDAILVIADAINRAGSTDPTAIRNALRETDLSGDEIFLPWEGVKFDEHGMNIKSSGIIVQYQGAGKDQGLHQVWPFESSVKDPQYPMVPWKQR